MPAVASSDPLPAFPIRARRAAAVLPDRLPAERDEKLFFCEFILSFRILGLSLCALKTISVCSGCSAVRLARQLREMEVAGSNPVSPTNRQTARRGVCFFYLPGIGPGADIPVCRRGCRPDDSGCSAVRLAHLLWEQGVTGSNPVTPTLRKKPFRFLKGFFRVSCGAAGGGTCRFSFVPPIRAGGRSPPAGRACRSRSRAPVPYRRSCCRRR